MDGGRREGGWMLREEARGKTSGCVDLASRYSTQNQLEGGVADAITSSIHIVRASEDDEQIVKVDGQSI